MWAVWASLGPATSHIQIRCSSLFTIRIYARLGVVAAAKTLGLKYFLKGPLVHQTVPYGLPLCPLAWPLAGFPCACVCFAFGWNSLALGRLGLLLLAPLFPGFAPSVFPLFLRFFCVFFGGNRNLIKTFIKTRERKNSDRNRLHFAGFP